MKINEIVNEEWSEKYKRSINCKRPKGFSQRAHCQGKKKNESVTETDLVVRGFSGPTPEEGDWVVGKIGTTVEGQLGQIQKINATRNVYRMGAEAEVWWKSRAQTDWTLLKWLKKVGGSKFTEGISESYCKGMGFDIRSDILWPAYLVETHNKENHSDFISWLDKSRNSQPLPEKNSKCILSMIIMLPESINVIYGPATYVGHTDSNYILKIPSGTHKYDKKNQIVFDSISSFEKFMTKLSLKFGNQDMKIEKTEMPVMESSILNNLINENLRDWFGKGKEGGAGGGGWDRYNTKGERIGKCGDRKPGEGKPKCLSKSRAASLRASGGKKAIANAVKRKKSQDKNPERKGKAKNVKNVAETPMTDAAKKPTGPEFGGYYGATQQGAPKSGQGFGSS